MRFQELVAYDTGSSAVAVIADRTANEVHCSCSILAMEKLCWPMDVFAREEEG